MRIDISTVLTIWILSSTAIPLIESEYTAENITVLNTTSTTLCVRWTVLTNQSISLIEYYNITLQADSIITTTLVFQVFPFQIVNATNNTFEYTIRDLQEFLSYNIRVVIVTSDAAVFTSRASTNATTNQAVPSGAPQNIMPLALNSTTIQVYWYPPPAAEQNGLITRYTLVYVGTLFNDSSSVDIYATATYPATSLRGPYNITGLQEYNNYSIEMRAVNAVGAGPFSTRVIQLTNQAAPDASPLSLMGVAINSTAICVVWVSPPGVNQNGVITHYNISYIGMQFDTVLRYLLFQVSPLLYPADAVQYSHNLTGLEAYTDYSIAISAINAAGIGPASVPVVTTTDEYAPDAAPLNINANAIDSTRIQVTWDPPPPINQNGEITSYNVTFYGSPLDTALQYHIIYIMSSYPDTTPYNSTLIGFEEYNNYTISIRAVNAVGGGPASRGITVATGIGAPDLPPQSLAALSVNTTCIVITWLPPPTLNQNGPILSYNITYRGILYDTALRSVLYQVAQPIYPTDSTGGVAIKRLSPYTNYTIGVSAVTMGGVGVFGYTRQITDEAAPTSPPSIIGLSSVSATEVNISWSPPLNTEQNGIITHYIIYYTASLFSNKTYDLFFLLESSSYPDTGTYTRGIAGLEEYVLYTFSIQAYTSVGASPESFEETIRTIQAVPAAPLLLTVTPVNASEVTISWKHPDKIDQNGPIVRYHISYTVPMSSTTRVFTYNLANPVTYPADPSVPLNATFTLELDQNVYVWYVTAENGAGTSAKSNNITTAFSNSALNIPAIFITTSIGGCCILVILPVALIYATVLLLLYCRRSKTTKINTIEATTVEMKSRTIFSNQGSLKELEKQEGTREAIYAVIGDNQFSSESAAGGSVVVTVENPIEIPKGEGLYSSPSERAEGVDPPAVVAEDYISGPMGDDENKLMENAEEPGEIAFGDESSEHYYDNSIQDQESQII